MVISKLVSFVDVVLFVYSIFDGNFGGGGGIADFRFYSGKFNNVTFNGNIGSAIRVSLCVGVHIF